MLLDIEKPVFRSLDQINELCSAIKGKFTDGARETHVARALTPKKKPREVHS